MAKKKPEVEEAPEVTIDHLVAVAEDFNTFMFKEGEEDINLDLEYDDLLKEITELAEDLVADDTVTAETSDTLAALGIANPANVSDADDDETDAQLAADLAVIKKSSKIEKIKEIAKLYKITVPPPFLKDLAKLKTYVVGKLDGSAPAKPKAEKAAKAPKVPKEKTEGINSFLEKVIPNGLGDKHEDEIVELAKKEFPDKPYRVIGNAIYAHCRKIVA